MRARNSLNDFITIVEKASDSSSVSLTELLPPSLPLLLDRLSHYLCLSISLYVSVSVCVSVCLSVCLSLSLSLSLVLLSVYLNNFSYVTSCILILHSLCSYSLLGSQNSLVLLFSYPHVHPAFKPISHSHSNLTLFLFSLELPPSPLFFPTPLHPSYTLFQSIRHTA